MRSYTRLARKVLKIKTLSLLVIGASFMAAGQFNVTPVNAAACASEPASTTGRSSQTITVPTTGTYTIWSRLKAPTSAAVEYKVYVNSQCFTIGQTALTPSTLTWVDHENGSTSDKATLSLTAGTHTLVATAGSASLELDRIMLISDSCTPTGNGDNCQNDTTLPTTSITSPSASATLTGSATITASAADNDAIDRVEFYRGGSTLLGTDSVAPFTYSWDTSSVTDGAYSLTVRAYDLSGNVRTSTAVSVTVNNTPAVNANITSFTATPSTITNGQSSTLAWNVSAGTGCSINQSVGSVGLTGSQSVSPTTTTTYTLTCNGTGGGSNASANAVVTVSAVPVDANITSFAASPTSITTGQSSTLSWSVAAGTGCSINQSVGGVATSGTRAVSPTITTTYALTCSGLNGGNSDTANVTVTVTAPTDTDGDGIMDHIEDAGPNNGDANHDSVPDSEQGGVVSFLNTTTSAYNTLVVLGADCDVISELSSAAGAASLQGVLSFTVDCDSPGQTAQVKLYLDKQYDYSNWKVNKHSADLSESLDITSRATFANETLGGRNVTTLRYDVTDGGDLDEDGVANGTIVDPIGIVAGAATDSPAPGAGGTGGELSNTGMSIIAVLTATAAVLVAATIGLAYYAKTLAFASRR